MLYRLSYEASPEAGQVQFIPVILKGQKISGKLSGNFRKAIGNFRKAIEKKFAKAVGKLGAWSFLRRGPFVVASFRSGAVQVSFFLGFSLICSLSHTVHVSFSLNSECSWFNQIPCLEPYKGNSYPVIFTLKRTKTTLTRTITQEKQLVLLRPVVSFVIYV